jgi:hypothetical protein
LPEPQVNPVAAISDPCPAREGEHGSEQKSRQNVGCRSCFQV